MTELFVASLIIAPATLLAMVFAADLFVGYVLRKSCEHRNRR